MEGSKALQAQCTVTPLTPDSALPADTLCSTVATSAPGTICGHVSCASGVTYAGSFPLVLGKLLPNQLLGQVPSKIYHAELLLPTAAWCLCVVSWFLHQDKRVSDSQVVGEPPDREPPLFAVAHWGVFCAKLVSPINPVHIVLVCWDDIWANQFMAVKRLKKKWY